MQHFRGMSCKNLLRTMMFIVLKNAGPQPEVVKRFRFKVYTTHKKISAYLKGLSKYRRMAFLFLKYLFLF